MEELTPFERKILKYCRKPVSISDITKHYGAESTDTVTKLYEMKMIDGEFAYTGGNLTAEIPIGNWHITSYGKLYLKNSRSIKIQNIKDKIIDNLISFILGVISGLVIGVLTGYIVFINHWL